MDELVQYHNPDYADFPDETPGSFSIYSHKRVDAIVGSRVWLIARRAETSEYYVLYWFVAAEVMPGRPGEPGRVCGRNGAWFRPALRIDTAPWFPPLQEHLGNFAFGLRRVTDLALRSVLVALAEESVPSDDLGDSVGDVAFSMDYARALGRVKSSLSPVQIDILSALCAAPGNELSGGQIARLLGMRHHAPLNIAVAGLAKLLTRAVEAEPPRRSDGSARWWNVVATGRDDGRRFFWRLRPALRDAVLSVGIGDGDRGLFADDVDATQAPLLEGAVKIAHVNAYERNPVARRRCIEHHGATCSACGVDFGSVYGAIGEGVIHVHHLRPIATYGAEYHEVDPIEDLRPVCPNCHVIVHRRDPPISIEEVREMLAVQRGPSDERGRQQEGGTTTWNPR